MKNRWKFTCMVVLLTCLDLAIKAVIHHNYMDVEFDILPPWFYFKPVYNTHYFYVGSIMGWQIPLWIIVVFSLLLILFLVLIYGYSVHVYKRKNFVNIAFAFGVAGAICAVMSNLLWPGCLDYIYLKPFYVFDLKDVYLNVFFILLVLLNLLEYKNVKTKEFSMWKFYKSHFKSSN